jgi:hypothetical protein
MLWTARFVWRSPHTSGKTNHIETGHFTCVSVQHVPYKLPICSQHSAPSTFDRSILQDRWGRSQLICDKQQNDTWSGIIITTSKLPMCPLKFFLNIKNGSQSLGTTKNGKLTKLNHFNIIRTTLSSSKHKQASFHVLGGWGQASQFVHLSQFTNITLTCILRTRERILSTFCLLIETGFYANSRPPMGII